MARTTQVVVEWRWFSSEIELPLKDYSLGFRSASDCGVLCRDRVCRFVAGTQKTAGENSQKIVYIW
jgi:hypothetical protein